MKTPHVTVIIPARDEAASIARVLHDIPHDLVRSIIVCDNDSRDETARIATSAGAEVVHESRRGYGSACLAALDRVSPETDVVVFLDADYSDDPREMPALIAPLAEGAYDLCIGSRVRRAETGALTAPQRFGNWLATRLIRVFFGFRYTDLGPFRAIGYPALLDLGMRDTGMGWTVEMQIKAVKAGYRITEVDVAYRPRIGQSKISGTVSGVFRAGAKILSLIVRHALLR